MSVVKEFFKDQNVIVTGGTGSVGKALVEKLLTLETGIVRIVDNNESELFDMEHLFKAYPNLEFMHADICDEIELVRAFSGMDYCLHAAALKHVPSCERSPFGAVNVNIIGVQNVIMSAQKAKLKKVLFTSTDKAVNPPNVMGASKLMGERLFTAANLMPLVYESYTQFVSTRFGNVASSRGSVIPLFEKQIEQGGPVTVTDERMSRFIMSLPEAAELVLESMVYAKAGDIFITKMPVLTIVDLAKVMVEELAPKHGFKPEDIEIKFVGARPGEKLWEELSSEEECRRILEGEKYLCVPPVFPSKNYGDENPLNLKKKEVLYHSDSEEKMTHEEIKVFLKELEII